MREGVEDLAGVAEFVDKQWDVAEPQCGRTGVFGVLCDGRRVPQQHLQVGDGAAAAGEGLGQAERHPVRGQVEGHVGLRFGYRRRQASTAAAAERVVASTVGS